MTTALASAEGGVAVFDDSLLSEVTALVEWPDEVGERPRPFRLLAFREDAFPDDFRERIHRVAAARVPGDCALAELASLDVELGAHFATAAAAVARQQGLRAQGRRVGRTHGALGAQSMEVGTCNLLLLINYIIKFFT